MPLKNSHFSTNIFTSSKVTRRQIVRSRGTEVLTKPTDRLGWYIIRKVLV